MRCVIISAAEIREYDKVRSYLSPDDFYIFCDGGLYHQEKLGVRSDLIVGDFDSYDGDITSIKDTEIIRLPREKDDTDTFYAVKEAIKRGFTDFLFLGVIGQRFDHSLVNISVLVYLYEHGFTGTIIDDYSEIEVIGEKEVSISDSFSYFSLLCIAGDVTGVTIKNAKYPLDNGEIKTSWQYACSNEVLPGKTALVSVKNGMLLLVKSR